MALEIATSAFGKPDEPRAEALEPLEWHPGWDGIGDPDPRDTQHMRTPGGTVLPIRRLVDLAADVDGRGPRRWLIRGVFPAGDYGVHGAEPKAGKTWNALDLAVSVATGTPWLGALDVDTTGPVIVFAGEGGDGNIVRRLRAIATARDLAVEDLDVWVCTRAPHLNNAAHMAVFADKVRDIRPALVIVDPLYLAAGGANGADLYAMGVVLERPQHICQETDAALLVVTHYNRSRDLKGAARLTGAGPAEWGRVLLAAAVISRHTEPVTMASTTLVELDVMGGEIPDQTLRVRRKVWATDPADLDSPLNYEVAVIEAEERPLISSEGSSLSPAARKLLAAVEAMPEPANVTRLVNWIAEHHGHGLKRPTCSTELNKLLAAGLVDVLDNGNGREKLWLKPSVPVSDLSSDRSADGLLTGVSASADTYLTGRVLLTGSADRSDIWPTGSLGAADD